MQLLSEELEFPCLGAAVLGALLLAVVMTITGCSTPRIDYADADNVQKIIESRKPEFRECYDKNREPADAQVSGRVMARFRVSAEGKVIESRIAESTLAQPRVESCVAETMKKLEFPKHEGGGEFWVNYPFKFTAH